MAGCSPFCRSPKRQHDADGLLHSLKDSATDGRLMAFWRAINDENLVGFAAQIGAHLLEARTVQKSGDSDEANDASPLRPFRLAFVSPAAVGVAPEDLPGRPAPEIDIEVTQVLGVSADSPFGRRLPIVERGAQPATAVLDPAAHPFRLLLIGRIADDYGDRLFALDGVGGFSGLGKARERSRYPGGVFVRVGQSVGHIEPEVRGVGERLHFFAVADGGGRGQIDDLGE